MRVATYYNNQDIRIEQRPIPKIGKGELLIKVRATSICGSDVMEWYRTEKVGRVLGHEISGEVVEVGEGIKIYKKGGRVAASHHVPCYQCHFCKLGHHTLCDTLKKTNFDPGGFSEFIRLSPIHVHHGVYPLPDSVSYDEATFIEPLACTIRAQKKAGVRKGQTVLVIGNGIAGLLHIMLARACGVSRLFSTDLNLYRLEKAKEFGADEVFQPKEDLPQLIRASNENRLADVIIVCSTSQKAVEQAFCCVERGGTILFFALAAPDQIIPLRMNEIFWQKGVTLMSSYAASPEEHRESLELIQTGQVPVIKMISHKLAFHEIAKGFKLVSEANQSLKVIVDPTS